MNPSYQGSMRYEESGENFQQLAQRIDSNIKKISQNVSSMSKMVNQLQTPQDSHELRSQLRHIQNYTQKLAKDTSSMLMELMKTPSELPASKITKDRLSDDYMATLNNFQAIQKTVAQKTKEDVRKVKAQSFKLPHAAGGNNRDGEQSIEMDEQSMRKQEQLTMQQERELQELEDRERDVRQLESDISDVNDIFKELGVIIHGQGTKVDTIEASVESAAVNVESATRELSQAVNYKNSLRKKKVYITIILTIIIVIIIIIIWNSVK